jgi:hypothetical protein
MELMPDKPTQQTLLRALRDADDKQLSDEQVALLAAAYVEAYSPVSLTDTTLAGAMLVLAARRVTAERAEMLLEALAAEGSVEAAGNEC